MQIKRYQDWLVEKTIPIQDCGCGSGSFITENISYDEVIANSQPDQASIEEAAGDPANPFVAGQGGSSGDILCLYASGYYSVDHTVKTSAGETKTFKNSDKFKPIVDKMVAFLKSEPKKTWVSEVVIKSSESIIPNFDMEGDKKPKASGWLSGKRKEKIQAYINGIIQPLVTDGTVSKLPTVKLVFEEAKTLTEPSGGWDDYRAWNKETDPAKKEAMPKHAEYANLKKGYDADQRTTVVFKVVLDLGPGQCAKGIKIIVSYDDPSVVGHQCDFANYQITANGIPLSTSSGILAKDLENQDQDNWIPAGTAFASMSNDNKSGDVLYKKYGKTGAPNGGTRKNLFWIGSEALAKRIIDAGDGKSIIVEAKCMVNGAGFKGEGGCHKDAPHVYVYTSAGVLADGFKPNSSIAGLAKGGNYPRTNNGIIARLGLCGNNLDAQTGAVKSSDGKAAAPVQTGPKLTGVKLAFAAKKVGTLSSEQAIQNLVTNGSVTKQADNTYVVNKKFTGSEGDIVYNPGDIINKILPKGSVIQKPVNQK